MFEYYEGYEIDGSDTSYNILIPEMEKLKEIVRYYLNLKIIRKDVPIRIIKVSSLSSSKLIGNEYMRYQLDKMWEDIFSENIFSFTISYEYVNPYFIYPEIKRELVSAIAEASGIEEGDLFNPVFLENDYKYGEMEIFIDEKTAKKRYNDYNEISGEQYCQKVNREDVRFIDVYCSLYGSHSLKYYAIYKMSKEFIELKIDPAQNMSNISWYYERPDEFLFEEIIVKSNDITYSLERILNNSFISTRDEDAFSCKYRGKNIERYNNNSYESYRVTNGGIEPVREIDTLFEALMGMSLKFHDGTVAGHVKFTNYIRDNKGISDEMFYSNSFIRIKIDIEGNDQMGWGVIAFNREYQEELKIIVPYKLREYVQKKIENNYGDNHES